MLRYRQEASLQISVDAAMDIDNTRKPLQCCDGGHQVVKQRKADELKNAHCQM